MNSFVLSWSLDPNLPLLSRWIDVPYSRTDRDDWLFNIEQLQKDKVARFRWFFIGSDLEKCGTASHRARNQRAGEEVWPSPAFFIPIGFDPPAMKKLLRKKVLVQLCRGETVIYARVIPIVAAAPAAYFPTGAFSTPNAFSGKVSVMPASGRGRQTSVAF
jgi:hypothetical protein